MTPTSSTRCKIPTIVNYNGYYGYYGFFLKIKIIKIKILERVWSTCSTCSISILYSRFQTGFDCFLTKPRVQPGIIPSMSGVFP